jgi:hypothetical protein
MKTLKRMRGIDGLWVLDVSTQSCEDVSGEIQHPLEWLRTQDMKTTSNFKDSP